MSINVQQRPAFTVVGMRIRTVPMSPDIPALWPRFVARENEVAGATEPGVTYGVMRSEGAALDYLAAVSVAPGSAVPAGMESVAVPEGLYALFSYPLSGLGEGFHEIFSTLIPGSGYVQRDGWLLERYDENFCPDEPKSLVQIAVPVAPRG
jgi:AraC family transcriptional regulator